MSGFGLHLKLGLGSGSGGGIALQPETIAFVARVEDDGGVVEDVNFLNSFIVDAKANNYFDDIVSAYSPSWGVKEATGADTMYSTTGAAFDVLQSVLASQPSVELNDLNGKTRLLFDGADDSIQVSGISEGFPITLLLAGFEPESWTQSDRIFDGAAAGESNLIQSSTEPTIVANGVTVNDNALTGKPVFARVLFNGATATKVQIDSTAETSGSVGVIDFTGITFGAGRLGAFSWANMSFGAALLINSAVDGSYDAKVTAIKDFFDAAYATDTLYGAIGDSFTSPKTYQQRIQDTSTVYVDEDGGVGGNTLGQIQDRFDAYVASISPSKCIIIGGINDIASGVSDPNAVMQTAVQEMVASSVISSVTPVLSILPPWGNHVSWTAEKQGWQDTFDAWITGYASSNGYALIDLVGILSDDDFTIKAAFDNGDGLHPNAAGYNAMGDAIVALLGISI